MDQFLRPPEHIRTEYPHFLYKPAFLYQDQPIDHPEIDQATLSNGKSSAQPKFLPRRGCMGGRNLD